MTCSFSRRSSENLDQPIKSLHFLKAHWSPLFIKRQNFELLERVQNLVKKPIEKRIEASEI
jgi:hypothetical protein